MMWIAPLIPFWIGLGLAFAAIYFRLIRNLEPEDINWHHFAGFILIWPLYFIKAVAISLWVAGRGLFK